MSPSSTNGWSAPRTFTRVGIALAGVTLFFVAANSMDPAPSAALSPAPPSDQPQTGAAPSAVHAGSLGRYEGVDHTIYIIATPEGPRYTITDPAGNILESLIEESELSSALEQHGIELGAPVDNAPLMLADEPDFAGVLDF